MPPPPPDRFPPADPQTAQSECFFLLKRIEDLLDVIDGKPRDSILGGRIDPVDYARRCAAVRRGRVDPKFTTKDPTKDPTK